MIEENSVVSTTDVHALNALAHDDLAQAYAARLIRMRRRGIALLCVSSMLLQQACYSSVPVTGSTPVVRGNIVLNVNDQGRLLVGPKLGPLLDHVDGRLVRADAENVEVAVETAEDVRGNIARWGGERFTFPRSGIESINEKRVSKSRTALILGGIVTAVVVAFAAIKAGKNKSGGDEGKPICCEPI